MKQIITLTESELKRAVKKSIKKVLDRPKRGWGDLGDHSTPERGYYYCEETDYSSGRVRRWIGDENDAKICRTCSEGGAYGPFNSRSDAVNFMKHFDKDYRERNEKIYGKSNKDDSYDELDESKIRINKKQTIRLNESQLRRIVSESVKRVLKEHYKDYPRNDEMLADAIDMAKSFLRDYSNSYYKDYPGVGVSFSGNDCSDGILRHAYYLYNTLEYQNCRDKKLMTAMKEFIDCF